MFGSLLACYTIRTLCLKNRPTFDLLNLYIHGSIATIFGNNVALKVGNLNILYFPTPSNKCFCTTWGNRKSPQYGELRPTNGRNLFGSLRHPCKFQGVSRLGFVTAATSLAAGQPNFVRCLAVSWPGTLYVHCVSKIVPPLTC